MRSIDPGATKLIVFGSDAVFHRLFGATVAPKIQAPPSKGLGTYRGCQIGRLDRF